MTFLVWANKARGTMFKTKRPLLPNLCDEFITPATSTTYMTLSHIRDILFEQGYILARWHRI